MLFCDFQQSTLQRVNMQCANDFNYKHYGFILRKRKSITKSSCVHLAQFQHFKKFLKNWLALLREQWKFFQPLHYKLIEQFSCFRIKAQNGFSSFQSLQQHVRMLLLDQIIEYGCKLDHSIWLSSDRQLILDRLGLLGCLEYLLIRSFSDHPKDAFEAGGERFEFLLSDLFLTHLNYYYKSNQMSATMSATIGTGETLIIDAIALFNEELKEKNLKRQAVQEVGTIALVLPAKRIRQELVPLLVKTFMQQTMDMRIAIIRSFSTLMEYLSHSNQSFVLLQFILDVLCAFSEEELRKEAYAVLQKILESLDLRTYQEQLIKVIRELTKENDKNIKEVVLRMARHLYIVAQNQNQQYLLQVIAHYRSEEEQILLAKELAEFIKIMPPFPENKIHSLLKELLASNSSKVRSKLVEPLILLAKALDQEATSEYFQALLGDTCPDVLAALVLQVQGIAELPSRKVLGSVLQLIDTPERHDSSVRAAILQVLQFVPLTQARRTYILSSNHFKSLSLSKALADSLCKIHDIQALGLLIESSDTEFKNKLFPKLPSACQIHVKLMEHIFAQKNWRSKLTLLQNIEKRMESQENVQIFIPKLLEQLGDKIGVLRSSVVRLLALIVRARRIQLKDLTRSLNTSMSSKNWFERQSVLILMQHLAPHYSQFSASDRSIFKGYISQGLTSSIHNLKSLSESIRSQCNLQID